MYKILVVGQTPPPHGGQSIMIERMLELDYSRIQLFHVRMSFSAEMDDIGRFHFKKIFHLISTVFNIFLAKIKHKTTVLYYPPAGPNKLPMYRDFVILICTRWLFRKTVFHFHAGGISELYPNLSKVERFLFRIAYFNPDGAILLSNLNPRDDQKLHSKNNFVVPYGIKDTFNPKAKTKTNSTPTILYVGILKESKGVLVLIDALRTLRDDGVKFHAKFIGKFESAKFKKLVLEKLAQDRLEASVSFTGVLTGDQKWKQFSQADIFCFPTFFESETFGLVVLEAMQYQLPVIASDWRGVPSLIDEGKTGYIVPARFSSDLSDKLKLLCQNPELAKTMGKNGRNEYLKNYSIDTFRSRIEEVFVNVAEAP